MGTIEAERACDNTVSTFLGFTHALRAAGMAVGPDRAQRFLDAVTRLDAGERRNVYWAGRSTLCSGPDDFARYDKAFERWFSGDSVGTGIPASVERSVRQADLGSGDGGGEAGEELTVAALASSQEALRHRDVADLSANERQHLARLFSTLSFDAPMRRSIRKRPHRRGDIDAARTVRDQLRRAGEPGPLRHRREQQRPRHVVLLIDISGSMEAYADSLLRLAQRIVAASPHTTEVFTLGTRLTRVTPAMRIKDPEQALRVAGNTVPDWSGGTRLGEVLRAFNNRWGQRGLARGAVVVIASDGWERGDPHLLSQQAQRLQRLAHCVIWSNPHRGKDGYAPIQGGIVAALPFVDHLVAGHSLAAFAELMELVSDA